MSRYQILPDEPSGDIIRWFYQHDIHYDQYCTTHPHPNGQETRPVTVSMTADQIELFRLVWSDALLYNIDSPLEELSVSCY